MGSKERLTDAAQQRSRQTTYSSGSVGSGEGGRGPHGKSRETFEHNGYDYEIRGTVRVEGSAKRPLLWMLDYDPWNNNRHERWIPHEFGVWIPDHGMYQVKRTAGGKLIGFRRESKDESPELEPIRAKLQQTPNVLVPWVGAGGASRRHCQTPEQRAKLLVLLAKLQLGKVEGPPVTPIAVPAGHTPVAFPTPSFPAPCRTYGNCPIEVLRAAVSGFLTGPPPWWDTALADFFDKHPLIQRPDPADKSTWWTQEEMNALCQFLTPHLGGRPLQITGQSAFLDALDQAKRRHLGLLQSTAVLLVYVAQGDDFHWILADGARRVWYPLDNSGALYILSKNDLSSETAARKCFEEDLQVDRIKRVYTLSIAPPVQARGIKRRGGGGSKIKKKRRN